MNPMRRFDGGDEIRRVREVVGAEQPGRIGEATQRGPYGSRALGMTHGRRLLPLFVCVAIVMVGVGITLSVLPFYAERMMLAEGTSRGRVGIHVTALTAIYAVMQLCFAPLWGRLSDRVGRRPLLIVGICGFAFSQTLFGLATTMPTLYGARALGGILSAALFPAASAYVADATTEADRARGMAWFNTAVGLGTMIGPALGGLLARRDLHLDLRSGYLHFDAFSVPFFVAALVSLVGLVVALRVLPAAPAQARTDTVRAGFDERGGTAILLLGGAFAAQMGIMMFEATFTLFAQRRLGYGPTEAGMVFMVCGTVMIPLQFLGIAVAKKVGELLQIAVGFSLMGVGLVLLDVAHGVLVVVAAVTMLGAGMAFVLPGMPSLTSKRARRGVGRALGRLNAAQSVGQVSGAVFGGLLFGWRDDAPYITAGVLMLTIGVALTVGKRLGLGNGANQHPTATL